ncbi:MAG: ABC transporter substrate-binding protein [Anaerolineales bacterium]|nr:ABC transporter substrate-binding protein [Anaerolineales bacterium]
MFNKYRLLPNGHKFIPLFFLLATVLILSACSTQAAPKTYRVGILNGFDAFADIAKGFKAKMTELGYVEGQNIVYDTQMSNFDPAKEQQIVKKFVADDVDLIFTFATEAALTAKAGTAGTDIPVVFAFGTLEGNDMVESVRQPGGNITGVRFPGPDLSVKRLDLLHQLAPQARRVGIIYNTKYPANKSQLEELHPAASSLGLSLVEVPITSVAEIQADLQARTSADDIGLDAILIITDDLSQSPDGWPMISDFAAEHKIPIAGSAAFEAETGAVFSYIPDTVETGKLAAPLADKILKGTSAGTIPVVTPESRLRLNYKVVQALGLTVPEGLLSQAAEIIR